MAIKILSMDDELDMEMLIQIRFRKQIQEKKFEFVFALISFLKQSRQSSLSLYSSGDLNFDFIFKYSNVSSDIYSF